MNINNAIADFLGQVDNHNTKRSYTLSLAKLAQWLDEIKQPLNNDSITMYRLVIMGTDCTQSTKNNRFNAINSFISYCNKRYNMALMPIKSVAIGHKVIRVNYSYDDLIEMYNGIVQRICFNKQQEYIKFRDLTLFNLALHGLRRSEMSAILLSDITELPKPNKGYRIVVKGKGNEKERIIFSSDRLTDSIKMLFKLECEINKIPLNDDRQLILNSNYVGLSSEGVRYVIGELTDHSLTRHDFRRIVATNMFICGYDSLAIAKWFGWSSLETAKKYDQRSEDVLQSIASKL